MLRIRARSNALACIMQLEAPLFRPSLTGARCAEGGNNQLQPRLPASSFVQTRERINLRWIQEHFTAEPLRDDSGLGPKADLQTKNRSYRVKMRVAANLKQTPESEPIHPEKVPERVQVVLQKPALKAFLYPPDINLILTKWFQNFLWFRFWFCLRKLPKAGVLVLMLFSEVPD